MLQLFIIAAAVTGVAMIANAQDDSPLLWGGLTFAICLASGFIPLGGYQMLLGGFLAVVLYMVYKIRYG